MGTFDGRLKSRMFLRKMRLLAVVTLAVSTVLIVAAIVILCLAFRGSSDRCESHECKLITASINKSMDFTVEPCDDLYKFTCGKWSQHNSMTEFVLQNSVQEQAVEDLHFKLNAQLRYPETSDSTTPIDFVKRAYEECIRVKQSDSDSEQLKAMVSYLSKDQDELGLLIKLLSLGESIIFNIKIAADPFNPSKYAIWLTPPRFNIDRDHLRNARSNSQSKLAVDSYRRALQQQSQTVLVNPRSVVDAINFEIALASTPALMQDSPDSKDRIMKMDFDKLQRALPSSSALNYLEIINRVSESVGSKMRVSLDTEVVVENLNYFKEIADIIEQLQPGVLESYLILRIIQRYGFALDSDFIAIDQNYMSKGRSNMHNFNQSSRCLEFFIDTFPDLMGKVYSQQVKVSKEQREEVETILSDLHASFKRTIDTSTWLTSTSKSILKDKLGSIGVKIAFPKWVVQDESNDWVERFDFEAQAAAAGDATTHYAYVRMIYLREKSKKLSFDRWVRSTISQDDWLTSPASLKVNYDYVEQSLEIPAAVIASGVYYNERWPQFLKYARLGTLLAHHMMHALDRTGVNFNSEGEMEKWLPNDTENELKKQMLCYVDKYRVLSDGEVSETAAKRSLDENYADCESIKIAFGAFQSNVGRVVKLSDDSFDRFTPNQLFILSYVSMFCGQATADARANQLLSQFLPLDYQAIFPVANSNELSSQFSCPVNSKLNTSPSNSNNKCKIW